MKTTVEIPDPLFRQIKARAALEGIPLRELFLRGLQFVMLTPPETEPRQHANFPLIHSTSRRIPLTDDEVYQALNNEDDLS